MQALKMESKKQAKGGPRMKRLIVMGLIAAVVFGSLLGTVDAKRYWGILMPTARAYTDTVLTLPTPTADYFFCCEGDSVNFRFFDADSVYVCQITLAAGRCHDSEGEGYRAKYVHINAPDASNTIEFWTQR